MRVTSVTARRVESGRTTLVYKLNGLKTTEEVDRPMSVGQIKRHFHSKGMKCRAKDITINVSDEGSEG